LVHGVVALTPAVTRAIPPAQKLPTVAPRERGLEVTDVFKVGFRSAKDTRRQNFARVGRNWK
jgi:hypothetical protein